MLETQTTALKSFGSHRYICDRRTCKCWKMMDLPQNSAKLYKMLPSLEGALPEAQN